MYYEGELSSIQEECVGKCGRSSGIAKSRQKHGYSDRMNDAAKLNLCEMLVSCNT